MALDRYLPKRRMVMMAAFISVFLSTIAGIMCAQSSLDEAWTLLQSGAENKSTDARVATMRVMQLIPGDARAVNMRRRDCWTRKRKCRGRSATPLHC